MSAIARNIRVRVANAGASAVEGNVAFTLDLADLGAVPVVFGPIVEPTRGATEMRPFPLDVLDTAGAITSAFSSGGRWALVGRLVDVQSNDNGAGWVTYGTGRLTSLTEGDGPGRFTIEVSDESWKARRGGVFDVADTTQLWPTSPKATWRGWSPLSAGAGRRLDAGGTVVRLRLSAGTTTSGTASAGGQEIPSGLISYLESDLVDTPRVRSDVARGNFRHLRLNYAGVDYEVVSFGAGMPGILGAVPGGATGPVDTIFESLREPDISGGGINVGDAFHLFTGTPGPYGTARTVTAYAWIYTGGPLPPATGAFFLHAPTAPPAPGNPLHIGLESGSHAWGTSLFGGGIHPATLTKRVWDALGVVYDSASIATLEADTSLPRLWLRVTETPENVEAWMQENVWGPHMLTALSDANGRRRLVDLRLPQDIDPDSLPVIDATNAANFTWSLGGNEAVNTIVPEYTSTSRPATDGTNDESLRVENDGFAVESRTLPEIEGDTVAAMGRRELTLRLHGAMEPTDDQVRRDFAYGGALVTEVAEAIARDALDIYQDGAVRARVELARSFADAIEEGDIAIVDAASLKVPNPGTAARTGLRLVRVLSLSRAIAYAEAELLDLGPSAQPLAAPTVDIVQDGDTVVVTIGGIPAGAVALAEVAYTDSADPPTNWTRKGKRLTNGTLTFGDAPGSGFAHARAKSVAVQRIRSPWTNDNVALSVRPLIRSAKVTLTAGGIPVVRATPNAHTVGARITAVVHAADEVPTSFHDVGDFAASDLPNGIALEDFVVAAKMDRITVIIEPWTGFGSGAVSGTAGPSVTVSAGRKLFERPLVPTIEFRVINTYVSEKDTEGLGPNGQGKSFPRLPMPALPFRVTGVVPEFIPEGLSSAGEMPDGTIDLSKRVDFEKAGKAAIDLQLTVRDPSGAGGTLSIWTNPDDIESASPTGTPDDVLTIPSTPNTVGPGNSSALSRIRVPSTGHGKKRMYARFDSVTGATSGVVPPFDEGLRLAAAQSVEPNDGHKRGLPGRGGFDTGYDEKLALLEEMHRDFLAGFVGERYLTPGEIRSADGLFTLMDGHGQTIRNLVIEDTVTDEGDRSISLFLAKPSSADPDDLDSVVDGVVFRRVISIDSSGQVTAASIKTGAVTAIKISVGMLSEITDDMGILVDGALIGTAVVLDLGATGSDVILGSANLTILADGSAYFSGTIELDDTRGDGILFNGSGAIDAAGSLVITGAVGLTVQGAVMILQGVDVSDLSLGANDSAGAGFRLLRVPNA